jgi:hypothetical protein
MPLDVLTENVVQRVIMLNYKFNKGLVRTGELVDKLSIPTSTLDFWKSQWRRKGNDCYDMGLRLIGKKAYWEPIQFVNWVAQNKLKNKATQPDQILDEKKLIAFVKENVKLNGAAQI